MSGADAAITFARAMGDQRTERQMAEDGARRTLSQIDKLRNQLRMAERDCQHVLATGNALKDMAYLASTERTPKARPAETRVAA